MRLTYDPAADAAYLYLVESIAPGGVAQTRLADLELENSSVAFDLDGEGRILGIEILGASLILPAVVLNRATPP